MRFKARPFHGDPLRYLLEHIYEYRDHSRSELRKKDQSLYAILRRHDQTFAVPTYVRQNLHNDPLRYFQQHRSAYRGASREDLHKTDGWLYAALNESRQLTVAIPILSKRYTAEDLAKLSEGVQQQLSLFEQNAACSF